MGVARFSEPICLLEFGTLGGAFSKLVVCGNLKSGTWTFSKKILNDCFKILLLGKKCILRSLLQVRKIFEFSGNHYILNKLFIDDYCTYIQGVDRDALTLFGNEVRYFIRYVTKDKFGLRIVPIEQTALTGEETNDRVYSFSFSDYDESTGTES